MRSAYRRRRPQAIALNGNVSDEPWQYRETPTGAGNKQRYAA